MFLYAPMIHNATNFLVGTFATPSTTLPPLNIHFSHCSVISFLFPDGTVDSNINWLAQPGAATWDVSHLNTKQLDSVHDGSHHVDTTSKIKSGTTPDFLLSFHGIRTRSIHRLIIFASIHAFC
jgi:hypothetical protein